MRENAGMRAAYRTLPELETGRRQGHAPRSCPTESWAGKRRTGARGARWHHFRLFGSIGALRHCACFRASMLNAATSRRQCALRYGMLEEMSRPQMGHPESGEGHRSRFWLVDVIPIYATTLHHLAYVDGS